MAATSDIVATYRGPGRVVRRILGQGEREDRALIYLMIGCLMVFVAQMPRLAREAHVMETDLPMMLGATLLAWLFIAPLIFYAIGLVSHLIARAFGRKQSAFGARLALFWALLASSPLMLLWGLTAGFIGPGIEMSGVGLLWMIVFIWFWVAGLIGAGRGAA
ncbi:YIP1 family protein [Sulfitobacter sp. TSTF-M16]|uniref:YIP1 family protein n=1 Tax=Sulfitobacter aestuariivivens TaxID=2766981 RepID=A0A927D4V9_9RHOB|nr:YIP1 family protein [Sulfitobacter aestuariivivens]MBD3663282.1 YIP1 family protein [Sulfitobacter aestuariivivens]